MKLDELPKVVRQETQVIRYKITKNYNRTNTTIDRKADRDRQVDFSREVELYDGNGKNIQLEIDFDSKQ